MKKTILTIGIAGVVTAAAALSCNGSKEPARYSDGLTRGDTVLVAGIRSDEALVARGHYLVTIMGCNDCHTPKVMTPMGPAPDTARALSGHPRSLPLPAVDAKATKDWVLFNPTLTAYMGPWGTSFAANLTSDESGVGNWTEEQFFRAMREGKYKGMENGRPLLPPMPWQQFRNATDEDLRAIFSYLKSTKPIENIVPAPVPPAAH